MFEMGTWDWILLAAAGYLAVMALVRLMRGRRDALVEELSARADLEIRRQALEKNTENRRKTIERLNQRAG